jgi:hypothetical protein
MNTYLNSQIINSKNTAELYGTYTQKNSDMEKVIKRSYGDVLTKDRKSYYETQELDGLGSWHTGLMTVYCILTVVFVLGVLFSPNTMSTAQKIGMVVLLVLYPFVIDMIVDRVVGVVRKVMSVFPKNVYT